MFLGHRTGVIAKLSKCRNKGCLSGSAYTCNLDQVSLHFAAPIGGQKSSLRQLSYFLNQTECFDVLNPSSLYWIFWHLVPSLACV